MVKRSHRSRGKLSRRRYLKHAPGPNYTHQYKAKQNVPENFNRIQSSNIYFADIEVKNLDPWRTSTSNRLPHNTQNFNPKRLSLIDNCAQVVAQNIAEVPLEFLDSWNLWKHVWSHVLRLGNDTPEIFAIFCKKFNSEPDFKCHHPNSFTNITINNLKICHRLENFHSNTDIAEIAKYSRDYSSYLYALTVSSDIRTLANPVLLTNINLSCLNISYLLLDDDFIKKMLITIEKEEKLPNLQIIIMHHCKNISENLVLLILKNTALPFQYIETDFMLLESEFAKRMSVVDISNYVKDTNWKYLSMETVLPTLPLGLKMYALANKFKFNYFNKVIVDLFMYPSDLTEEKSWDCRKRERQRLISAYSYIKDPNHIPVMSKRSISEKPTLIKRSKKPKLRKINSLNDFFGI